MYEIEELLETTPWIKVSSSVILSIVVMIMVRGVASFFYDMIRVLSRLCRTQYKDKEVQTEPYYALLPLEVHMNPNSEVYHVSGCHHIGVRSFSKAVCTVCKNTW